jgi:DHA1 family multidrug resistance protein-like MFS transporter
LRAVAPATWRRNLAALWIAEFTAILGFSFAFPFLPLFLHRELGVKSGPDLAFWTGIVASVTGFSLALTSPIWGMLADRYGRKPMLLRAMVGGGASVGLMGLSQNVFQLTGLRVLQGAASGTVAAATALVASETPPGYMAWAFGVLSSAISLGSAVGPSAGGVAGNLLGLRAVFLGGGVLLLLSTIPVLLVVRESPLRIARPGDVRVFEALRAARPRTLTAIGVLIACQALLQASFASAQQLIVLRLLQIDPAAAQTATGIAFGASGIATAVAGLTYARVVRRTGYRALTASAALLMAIPIAAVARANSLILVVILVVVASFLYGALIPATSSMIGLEAPARVQATIFGVSSSAVSLGFGVGPLSGGLIAAAAGVPAALYASAAVAILLAALLGLAAREPQAIGTGH